MVAAKITPPTVQDVGDEYDPDVLRRLLEFLRDFEEITYTNQNDVQIVGAPDAVGRRPYLVLRAPDGSFWRVKVDNSGVLSTEAI